MIKGSGDVQTVKDYIAIGPLGSRNSTLTAFKDSKHGIAVTTGCFYGSIDEFVEAVESRHSDNPKVKKEYLAVIEFIKVRFKL